MRVVFTITVLPDVKSIGVYIVFIKFSMTDTRETRWLKQHMFISDHCRDEKSLEESTFIFGSW